MPGFYSAPEVVTSEDPEVLRVKDDHTKFIYDSSQYLGKVDNETPTPPKMILGLSLRNFWLLMLLMVVIVAGAIAAGVGGDLASQHAKESISDDANSSSRSSNIQEAASSTISTAYPSSTNQFYSGCPGTDSTDFTPRNAVVNETYQINGTILTYRILCGINFTGDHSINPDINDLQLIYGVQTMEDCITLCASYNYALSTLSDPEWSSLCSGVVYSVPASTQSSSVRCYLKSGVTANSTNAGTQAESDSALLIHWGGMS